MIRRGRDTAIDLQRRMAICSEIARTERCPKTRGETRGRG